MPRRPLIRLQKLPEIQPWKIQVLRDGIYPDEQGFEALHFFYADRKHDSKKELYKSIHEGFLGDWIEKYPCARPWAWYEYDAPRWDDPWKDCFYHGTFAEPRQHISGGKLCEYNYVPKFYKGIFKYWHYTEDDLPIFESEAAYLKRLNLLTEEEEKHLSKHPELLEPISIVDAIPGVESEVIL